jgi:hypothetical protein
MKKKQKNQIGFCVLRGGARSKRVIKAHGRRQEVISLASRDSFCDLLVELAIIQTTTSNINIIKNRTKDTIGTYPRHQRGSSTAHSSNQYRRPSFGGNEVDDIDDE